MPYLRTPDGRVIPWREGVELDPAGELEFRDEQDDCDD